MANRPKHHRSYFQKSFMEAFDKLGPELNYQRYKTFVLEDTAGESEAVCSFSTFERMLSAVKMGSILNPTRVKLGATIHEAQLMAPETLLHQILSNSANYELVEMWVTVHKPRGLDIHERKVFNREGETVYPRISSSIDTALIKAFIGGFLYANSQEYRANAGVPRPVPARPGVHAESNKDSKVARRTRKQRRAR